MIKLENISKSYTMRKSIVQAIKNVSLEVEKGDFIGIAGPSGSGKTTLLNILGFLDVPDSGRILLEGKEIDMKSKKELAMLRNKKIGFIFQTFNLIPVLNVYENVEFPFLVADNKNYKNRNKFIRKIIDEVGLTPYIKHRSNELSGGQMQRVAIARALVLEPQIVLADEPTANLDSGTSRSILKLMRSMNEHRQTIFVFATHDPLVMEYMNRIIHLRDGQIINNNDIIK